MYDSQVPGERARYMKRLQESLAHRPRHLRRQNRVGNYIIEDMKRGGLRNVTGVNFTDASKEAMATCLKEQMRSAVCTSCGWRGYVARARLRR